MPPDLVVIGNLIVDDIVYEDGSTRLGQPGGAILYTGLASSLWGLDTGLVSVAGSDYPKQMLGALRSRGIDLTGVRRLPTPGLRTWLIYEGSLRKVVHQGSGASHREVSPGLEDLPSNWYPQAIHLAPMPFAHQRDLVHAIRERYGKGLFLSLDPFNLLSWADLPSWRKLAADLDLMFLSQDEMASTRARDEPLPLLRQLFSAHLKMVFYKRGERGGLAVLDGGQRYLEWAARAAEVRDTTGAGDAFAAGVLAGLLQTRTLPEAIQMGVISASFAIEGQGSSGLINATNSAVRRRLEEWFSS